MNYEAAPNKHTLQQSAVEMALLGASYRDTERFQRVAEAFQHDAFIATGAMFQFIKDYLDKHGSMPTDKVMLHRFPDWNPQPGEFDYWFDEFSRYTTERAFESAIHAEYEQYLKDGDAEGARDRLLERLSQVKTTKGRGNPLTELLWAIADEEYEHMEDRSTWLMYPWIRPGSVTEVIGKRKGGKSTFIALMVRVLLEAGGSFLGQLPRINNPPRILWLTEERETHLHLRTVTGIRGLPNEHDDLLVIQSNRYKDDWESMVNNATQLALEYGCELVIFDNLTKQASVRDENDNAEAARKMKPIHDMAGAGLAVVVLRHDGKGYADNEDAGRGASAWEGEMDIIIRLRMPPKKKSDVPGDDDDSTFRILEVVGRWEAATSELIKLDRTHEVLQYEMVGQTRESMEKLRATQAMTSLGFDEEGALTVKELADKARVSQDLVARVLDDWVKQGKANKGLRKQQGRGRPSTIFWLTENLAENSPSRGDLTEYGGPNT